MGFSFFFISNGSSDEDFSIVDIKQDHLKNPYAVFLEKQVPVPVPGTGTVHVNLKNFLMANLSGTWT